VRVGPLAAGALTLGARGRVLTVHRRAVNLLLEDGPLVALLPEGTPIHPWALAAPLDGSRLAPGDPFGVSDDPLEVGPFRFALKDAERVKLRLRARPKTWPAEAAREISEHLSPSPPDDPFDAILAPALACFRAGGDARELLDLVGLGEGLTPSGDDILVGVLAGLDALAEIPGGASMERSALCAALRPEHLARTNTLSAQMLAAASAGLYAEPVLWMAQALPAETAAVDRAAATLLSMGHRSGVDTLRGLAAALAWARGRAGYL
jgi:hypothetical protein